MIYISNLEDLEENARLVRPSHVVSLVEREQQPPTPLPVAADRHLRLEVHDISEPQEGCVAPDDRHIEGLVRFVHGWPSESPLLVHCIAGVSRSTAAALIALSLKSPAAETDLAFRLRAAAPHAQPNERMIAIADRILGRGGRLMAARAAMGPAIMVMKGPLVALPLAA